MIRGWKRYMGGGIAFAAAVAFASTLAATSVQADHRHSWNGIVMGGIIGGAIGSTIGKGSGRLAAIGVGTLLGSIHGRHLAEQHHRPWLYHRPAHRHHRWHGHRVNPHAWRAPRHRQYHQRYHHGWKQPQVYTPIVFPPQPLVVHPRTVVHAPERDGAGAVHYDISGSVRAAPRQYDSAFTECRVLEDGWTPVYACRGAGGDWRILR